MCRIVPDELEQLRDVVTDVEFVVELSVRPSNLDLW